MAESDLETLLAFQCKAFDVPMPEREYRFDRVRRWRFDFAWPDAQPYPVALEIDGGIYGGRHVRPAGFAADIEKRNAAQLAGWRVYHATALMVRSGEALTLIQRALGLPVSEGFYVAKGVAR